jgi:sugar/nucleoside kinase (ribokinase family)
VVTLLVWVVKKAQKRTMKKIVTFGEIMLRLSPPGWKRFSQASSFELIYGGGESNVAVSLANSGLASGFVTRLSANAPSIIQSLLKPTI